jgi:hypothetical protein
MTKQDTYYGYAEGMKDESFLENTKSNLQKLTNTKRLIIG